MRRKKIQPEDEEDEIDNTIEGIRPIPLYMIFGCGLTIILIGIYLFITDTVTSGTTGPGRFSGVGRGTSTISGRDAILIGILFCTFPAYIIWQDKKKKKRSE